MQRLTTSTLASFVGLTLLFVGGIVSGLHAPDAQAATLHHQLAAQQPASDTVFQSLSSTVVVLALGSLMLALLAGLAFVWIHDHRPRR